MESNHHYVPKWYQKRFKFNHQQKYYYLDLEADKYKYYKKSNKHQGLKYLPLKYCFKEKGLYSQKSFSFSTNKIESQFFGEIDAQGAIAIDRMVKYLWHVHNPEKFLKSFIIFLNVQHLRTPRGMFKLKLSLNQKYFKMTPEAIQNTILDMIQKLKSLFSVIWLEGVWEIVSAEKTKTKFIVSDNPIILYNKKCYPGSKHCSFPSDPMIEYIGTQTIFFLDFEHCLIISNREYVFDERPKLLKFRKNVGYFRNVFFNFTDIIRERELSENNVISINYIAKKRAHKYIAAAKQEFLYPELYLQNHKWPKLGECLLPVNTNLIDFKETYVKSSDGKIYGRNAYGEPLSNQSAVDDIEYIIKNRFKNE